MLPRIKYADGGYISGPELQCVIAHNFKDYRKSNT